MKGAGAMTGGGCRAPRAGPGDSSVPLGEPVEAVGGVVPAHLPVLIWQHRPCRTGGWPSSQGFWRIPPHSLSSRLDGCLSSQLGHRALQNERGCLSSHQAQCGNPPALWIPADGQSTQRVEQVSSLCGNPHWTHTHPSSPSSSLLEGRPSWRCCHPSSQGPASSAHPTQGGGMPWSLAQGSG